MIDLTTKLSVSRKAVVFEISRGSIYYKRQQVSGQNLMHSIDKLHMKFPFSR